MKIHANILDFNRIAENVPDNCYLATFDHPGFGWTRCGYEGSRSHERGFVVRLSGSSRYHMAGLPDKAATYEQWGDFIANLFSIEPSAKIGQYKNAEDFEEKTRYQFLVRPRQGA